MWSALENIALRESLPSPLKTGKSIHDILVAGQLDRGRYNLHHVGLRRSKQYLLKQFYSINTNAFLRWQNEARFIALPQTPGYTWPCEEWRGGLIMPFADGIPIDIWLGEDEHRLKDRLKVAARLAHQVSRLHASGIAHRDLSPSCIRIGAHGLSITDFGSARCEEWDDLWSDSFMEPGDKSCASPDFLKGKDCGYNEDVYAFGAILHLLLSGKTAFGSFKMLLRPTFPDYIAPSPLPKNHTIPNEVRMLVSACLAPMASDRPFMEEASAILDQFGEPQRPDIEKLSIPTDDATIDNKEKIIVFIKDDIRAVTLFDAALHYSTHTPSVFLFVGLIPNNLPSGHAERFKGNLFKKLGQGLMRCRAANLPWSLRVLENTDPGRTAVELIRLYQPDQVFVGESEKNKTPSFRRSFQTELAAEGTYIKSIA